MNFKRHPWFFRLALALCAVVLSASAGLCANLSATVTDQNQTPLENAKVYLYTASDSYAGQYAYSDASGTADLGEIDTLDAGSYKLKAKYLGREIWSDPITLPDQSQAAVVIDTAPVTVTVTYAGGRPAADSKVYLYSDTDSCLSLNGLTDASGQVQLNLPVGGAYKFRARLLSQYYWSEAITVSDGAANAATIDAGGGQLTVTIGKEAAAPLADVTLKLYNPEGCYLGQSGASQADGSVVFDVSAGTYRIRADYLGHQFWSADTSVDGDTQIAITIAHQDVTITVAGQFAGAQTPIEDAKVQLYTDTGCWVSLSAYSDAAGQATFSLPGKPYKVCAYYLGQKYWSDVFGSTDISVQIPMAEADVAVTWSGAPLEGVPVQLFTATGGWTGVKQTTNAAGKALFAVPAGTWQFRADYQSNQYWSTDNALSADVTSAIELSTGGGTLSLTVTKDDGTPLEGLNCTVYNANGSWTGVKGATNSQGLVDLDLAEGSYKIRVDYLGHQFWSEVYSVTAALEDNFQIPHTDVQISVHGVFDTTSTPLENVIVRLYTGSGCWTPLYELTDAAGQAVFSLPEKEYKVRVDYLQSQTWSPVFTAADTGVDIALADVEVTVTGAGHGLENAKVHVYTESEAYVGVYGYSDAGGRITFRLPQGSYKFRAEYLGHKFWSEVLTPAAGQTTPLEIATGGGNFTFTVLQDAQTPIAGAKCYLYNSDGTSYLGLWAYSDENGQVAFDLVDGSYAFKVKYLGYDYFSPEVEVPQNLSQTLTIDHSDVTLTINGVGETTAPIEGAKVYLYTAAGGWIGQTRYSDADGQVTYALPANDYKVQVRYLGHYFWSDSFNSQPADVNIPMAKATVTVSGAGEQFEGVKVYAYTGSGGWLNLSGITDIHGRIGFSLPVGEFKFAAYYQSKKFYSDIITLAAGDSAEAAIDTGGGVFGLKLQKDPYHPLANVKCYVYTDTDKCVGMYGTTDDRGDVSFALSQGVYKFKIRYQGNYYWTDTVAVPEHLAHTHTLEHVRHPVFFQAINPGPAPLADIKVYAYTDADKSTGLYGYTDASGRIDFDLAPGLFKAKYYYDGQYHWTGLLQPQGTLISIDQNGGALNAVADLSAGVTADNQVALSWSAPADASSFAGYAIYRRHACEPDFVRINADLIDAGATGYTDSAVSPPGTYTYYIAALSGDGVQGYPSDIAGAQLGANTGPSNTTPVTDLTAAWNQGVATLTWSAIGQHTYQIFRGTSSTELTPFQRCTAPPFEDPQADTERTWYYQVASVITVCDPDTGKPVDVLGPMSALMTLMAVTAPVVTGDDLPINGQGDYVITTGAGSGYTLQGSYSGFSGEVTVTAVLGDQQVTGSASNGAFSIDLPSAGDWQIILSDANGWQSATIDTDWRIDDQPPSLTVDGAETRSTTESQITITGQVSDDQSALEGVGITSDQYPGLTFTAAIGDLGTFSAQVPLKTGDNVLTVTAADVHANSTFKTITVSQLLTALPVITITSPADGATVTSSSITVSGTVRSSLPAEQIRLILNDKVIFPESGDAPYNFSFDNVMLVQGSNNLTVRAETAYGNVSAQTTVQYGAEDNAGETAKPRIQVFSPLPDTYLGADTLVTGLVTGESPITAVTVNAAPADQTTGLGTAYVSFKSGLSLSATSDTVSITIEAADAAGQSTVLSYNVHADTTAPVIAMQDSSLQAPPAVNTVTMSPYVVSGTVVDRHLAGLTINDQPVSVTPTGAADTYAFSSALPLTYGSDQSVVVDAWDLAGNRTGTEMIVRLDSNLTIEVIEPRDGAELQGQGDQTAVAVTVRVAGAQSDDVFKAAVNGAAVQPISRNGQVGSATFNVPTAQAEHSLTVVVENSAGTVLSTITTRFGLRNMDDIALAVESIKPANGATGIEPNDFMALYFNKPVDPSLLHIEVLETAHGKTYGSLADGADITQLTKVELIDVSREREPVPGSISHFPANRMAAFYPKRDLAYGATVFVTATYDGQELARAVFNVRSLPTFIEGTVQDTLRLGLPGIRIAIPELGLTTQSDGDGGFGFGFQMPAHQNIAGGRYKVIANARMQNHKYGIIEQWVTVTQGRLNSMEIMLLPAINPHLPFRRIVSGDAQAVLADGALILDLSGAELGFADLRDRGDVHVQLLNNDEICHKFLPSLAPYWMFAVQPAGITVTGKVGLQIGTPTSNGTHAYMQTRGKYYVLLGLDPDALMIVPVGLAEFDYANRVMTSLWPVPLERLDYLGYAMAPAEAYPYIEQCARQEISFEQMISEIEGLR